MVSYSAAVRKAAENKRYPSHAIDILVRYSEQIERSGLPVIFDHEHLSRLTSFKTNFLYAVSNAASLFYHSYKIKKRTGGIRIISEPLPDLKILQRWILDEIISKLPVSKFAHAYRPGRSVKTNAKLHIGRPVVVKVDIVDFFGSIKVDDVFCLMSDVGYSAPIGRLLANLITLDGSLPQGAPTSAGLSNAIMFSMDESIGAWAIRNGWRYTRYADDLTFSGDGSLAELFECVLNEFNQYGFVLNKDKTRVMRRGARQVVCGVVVNDKMGPSRNDVRKFEQEVYFIEKYGLASHIDRIKTNRRNYIDSLIGRGSYLLWLSAHWPDRCERLSNCLARLSAVKMSSAN